MNVQNIAKATAPNAEPASLIFPLADPYAMPAANIDTDVIMPKAYLKGIDRSGLAIGLFHDLRFDEDGAVRRDFILNRADMAETRSYFVRIIVQ